MTDRVLRITNNMKDYIMEGAEWYLPNTHNSFISYFNHYNYKNMKYHDYVKLIVRDINSLRGH